MPLSADDYRATVLFDEAPLVLPRTLIRLLDRDYPAALFLQQVHYRSRIGPEHDGFHWAVASAEEWQDECLLTPKQFKRVVANLTASGLIIREQIDASTWDRTAWTRVDYDRLEALAAGQTPRANGTERYVPRGTDRPRPRGTDLPTPQEEEKNTPHDGRDQEQHLPGIPIPASPSQATERKPRKRTERDDLWDAICAELSLDVKKLTESQTKDLGKTAREVFQAGGRARHIGPWLDVWREQYPEAEPTHRVLRQHWAALFGKMKAPEPVYDLPMGMWHSWTEWREDWLNGLTDEVISPPTADDHAERARRLAAKGE